MILYEAGEKVADISKAYGHASEASTLAYLGIDQRRVGAMCRKYQLTVDFPKRALSSVKQPRPPKLHPGRHPALHLAAVP